MIHIRVEGRVDQLHDGVDEIRDMLDRLVSSESIVEDSGRTPLKSRINGVPDYVPTSPALSSGFRSTSSPQNPPPAYWRSISSFWKSGESKNIGEFVMVIFVQLDSKLFNIEDSSYTQLQRKSMIDTHQTTHPVMPSQHSLEQVDTHTSGYHQFKI